MLLQNSIYSQYDIVANNVDSNEKYTHTNLPNTIIILYILTINANGASDDGNNNDVVDGGRGDDNDGNDINFICDKLAHTLNSYKHLLMVIVARHGAVRTHKMGIIYIISHVEWNGGCVGRWSGA